jgi:hypothetical protein
MNFLDAVGDLASIFTASVAVVAYGDYRLTLHRRIRAMEKVLAKKTQTNDNSLTVSQVAALITATEDQVIEAAAKSKRVKSNGGRLGNGYSLMYQAHESHL